MQIVPVRSLSCILVAHADPLIRLGLVTALQESDFQNDVHTCNPREDRMADLLEFASVVVTDYDHGISLCTRLRTQYRPRPAPTQVVVVSARDGEHEIRSAIDCGVRGYLLTGCELDEFVEGVRAVSHGARHLCIAAAHRVVDSMSREPLTSREMQVLECLVDGYVNKRICTELNIALGTVKAHVKSVFSKLGVSTRTQAVSLARSRGIVSLAQASLASNVAPRHTVALVPASRSEAASG